MDVPQVVPFSFGVKMGILRTPTLLFLGKSIIASTGCHGPTAKMRKREDHRERQKEPRAFSAEKKYQKWGMWLIILDIHDPTSQRAGIQ